MIASLALSAAPTCTTTTMPPPERSGPSRAALHPAITPAVAPRYQSRFLQCAGGLGRRGRPATALLAAAGQHEAAQEPPCSASKAVLPYSAVALLCFVLLLHSSQQPTHLAACLCRHPFVGRDWTRLSLDEQRSYLLSVQEHCG